MRTVICNAQLILGFSMSRDHFQIALINVRFLCRPSKDRPGQAKQGAQAIKVAAQNGKMPVDAVQCSDDL